MSAVIDTRACDPLDLVREDLRDFGGYRSARSDALQGEVWLNANESPWANVADEGGTLRRYPDPQPVALRNALAGLYACAPEQVLAGRGSDEGIDLLIRAVCRPGGDAVLITSPTFGMYAVCARLHGTPVIDVPLLDDADGWRCDFVAVEREVLARGAKLVFLCSPGNPNGAPLPLAAIESLARRLQDQALVVVDEAYWDYADGESAIGLIARQANIVVLRTLSKAHALPAARIGTVVADARMIAVLRRCQAPYPLPLACVEQALAALSPPARAQTQLRVASVKREREVLTRRLPGLPGVRRVYASEGNFVLVRFDDAQDAFERLLRAGVVVRDMRAARGLGDALRITVGTPEQNQRVLQALAKEGEA